MALLRSTLAIETGNEIIDRIIAISPFFQQTLALWILLFRRGQEDMIAPAPPDELAELLKDEEIENAASGDLVIVVAGNAIPVQALESLRQGNDERDGQGVGIAKDAHGCDEVGRSFGQAKGARDDDRDEVGDGRLHDEDDGNDGEIEQFLSRQLAREFGKD